MTNLEKVNHIFMDVFQVEESSLSDNFNKDQVDGWDSVRQLCLTSAIEDELDLLLDAEDILEFTSYKSSLEILKKYIEL